MNPQLKVRVISSLAEIDEIRDVWTAWQRHPNADVDFYLTLARSSPDFVSPYILVVYRSELPEAMLIGRVERRRIDCKLGYQTLLRPQALVLNFIYGGLLGNASEETNQALVDTIMLSLRKGGTDIAYLNLLRTDSPLYEALTAPRGFRRCDTSLVQTHRGTILSGETRQIIGALPRRIQRRNRKLASDFHDQIRINCFHEPAQLEQMIEDVEDVAKHTYQRGLGVGFVDGVTIRQRLHLEADKGWLRAYLLYVADRPRAFWIGTLYHGTFHTNFTGYDASYSRYSPGIFLLTKVIEDIQSKNGQERACYVDWGLGDAEYKTLLGTCEWREATIRIFAPTLNGFRLQLLMTPMIITERYATKALQRLGLLETIKKVWRKHVRQKLAASEPGELEEQHKLSPADTFRYLDEN